MTLRAKNTYWLYKHQINKTTVQSFKKFFILDFEATCDENGSLSPQEIIEFPCLAINSSNLQIEGKFHRFVKPKIHPQITSYCTQLTGITQNIIENEPEFPIIYDEFLQWLQKNLGTITPDKAIFITSGNWDLKIMFPQQCKFYNLEIPQQMKQWINIKTAFYRGTGHYPRSLSSMYKYLNITMTEKLHSGIGDCYSILTILSWLMKNGLIFEKTDQL
ncbi:hypothetical protein PGB90_009138 [Kerria lacca]